MDRYGVWFFLGAALMAHAAWAADDPFIGEWKLDQSKSHLIDQMKVTSLGSNRYAFDFGGSAESIAVDGTDQPGFAGTTLAVTAKGPDAWEVVRKKDGKVIIDAGWTLSNDGNSLADHFTSFGAEGAASTVDLLYGRTGGTSGFAGTWERYDANIALFVITIKPDHTGGLALSYLGKSKDLGFDGKDRAPEGPSALVGTLFSATRLGPSEIEVTDKYQGVAIDTQEFAVSADRKTLTMTVRHVGRPVPDVLVFQRQ